MFNYFKNEAVAHRPVHDVATSEELPTDADVLDF
jgi:hypothetical protein